MPARILLVAFLFVTLQANWTIFDQQIAGILFSQRIINRYLSNVCSLRESETLAWASAQIVCLCSINPQKVSDPSFSTSHSHHGTSATSTSLSPSRGEHGCVIYSTKPKILICDLSLASGQHKECE